jgi:glycosyltransferase involved in cell wall biosynthesis
MEAKEKGEDSDSYLGYSKVCFLSNFPPKECGIATFTKDLTLAMNKRFNPRLKSKVIALNEKASLYNYSNQVIMQINKDDIKDYLNTAEKVNNSKDIKLICIQHEFGLFGGEYGSKLLHFLEAVEKPVVIAFHSVLPSPDEDRKKIVKAICSKAAAIIVMAHAAVEILNRDYDLDKSKIHVVHHGIPNVPFVSDFYFKKKLKLDNKIVLSTFGLLSRGKGIEYMIKALPFLVKKYPNLLYLVIGETHPVIRKKEGEKYRNELIRLVNKLGLKDNVKFYNRYVTLQEIVQYLLASDIYVCTNLERNQIVSGTLSYALGCGRATISTPSRYSEEMLSNEKGLLAEFKNPESFTEAIDRILSDEELKRNLERRAYSFTRPMIWQNIASRYLHVFNRVVRLREETTKKFPTIKLHHLRNLTDEFGCIQFSKDAYPDKSSGYTLDDNARALIAAVLHHNMYQHPNSLKLAETYLSFLENSQEKRGNFKNNFNNENEILDSHSPDAFGRAIWALGYAISKTNNRKLIKRAKRIFENSYKRFNNLIDLRAKAFSIIGLYHFNQRYRSKKNIKIIKRLANSLVKAYRNETSENWHWFEKEITYSNSKLPEALFLTYALTKNRKYLETAEKTLHFLSDITFIDDEVMPIGQNGWYKKNGKRALFDQQPVDVSSIIQTFLVAHAVTGDRHCHEKAVLAFNWFLGKNYLKQMVYNETTGGCYDGLSKDNLNLNQGAESTISYLLARLMLEEVKGKK